MKSFRNILLVLFTVLSLSFLTGCNDGDRTIVYRQGHRFCHKGHCRSFHRSKVYLPVWRTHSRKNAIIVTPNRRYSSIKTHRSRSRVIEQHQKEKRQNHKNSFDKNIRNRHINRSRVIKQHQKEKKQNHKSSMTGGYNRERRKYNKRK